jgi:hypothetical protein
MKILCIETKTDREFNILFNLLKSDESLQVDKSKLYDDNYDFYITNGNITDQLQLKTSYKPIILYLTTNPFVEDIESFVYNKENHLSWLHKTSLITQIWIQCHCDKYRVYLETIYKLPVSVVPFSYDLPEKISSPSIEIQNSTLDIVLFESNRTFNDSSLKLLYICQEYYNLYADKLGTVYLFNMPENDVSYKIIESLDLWKHKKLRIFKNLSHQEILTFFKSNRNRTIFLGNTILNNIHLFMYDIVYNDLTLLHTQKEFPYGVYYDLNDIKTSIQLLHNPIICNKRFTISDIESYNSNVKTYIVKYIKTINPITINMHEFNGDIHDITKPLVITYDNAPTENTWFYINTLKKNKWDYMLIGKEEKWEGCVTRMNAYMNALKTLPPNKIVVLTYARDVICCRSSSAFMDAFKSFSSDMVVCMELMCDYQFDRDQDYVGYQCHTLSNYWKHHSYAIIPKRKYVNNGLVVGKVSKLIELMKYGIDNKYIYDQFSLGSFVNKHPTDIGVDTEADIFHTSCFGVYSGMKDINLQKTDSPTFAELFGRAAFFLHIPGIEQIKGAKVLYKTVKALIESGIDDTLFRECYECPEPSWIPTKNIILYQRNT